MTLFTWQEDKRKRRNQKRIKENGVTKVHLYFRKPDEEISDDATELCSQIWSLKVDNGSLLLNLLSIISWLTKPSKCLMRNIKSINIWFELKNGVWYGDPFTDI